MGAKLISCGVDNISGISASSGIKETKTWMVLFLQKQEEEEKKMCMFLSSSSVLGRIWDALLQIFGMHLRKKIHGISQNNLI